ncbi:hypothetical protein Zmor_000495 [Zophobas morio]|uniref:Uncharacterized protein n=1 Tax=Zophobas morio TaxID=2755281 RepID=A0AA38IWN2_9CUCU|nr:hypothetical protein Zmor_000495 [Zophobas morio]
MEKMQEPCGRHCLPKRDVSKETVDQIAQLCSQCRIVLRTMYTCTEKLCDPMRNLVTLEIPRSRDMCVIRPCSDIRDIDKSPDFGLRNSSFAGISGKTTRNATQIRGQLK